MCLSNYSGTAEPTLVPLLNVLSIMSDLSYVCIPGVQRISWEVPSNLVGNDHICAHQLQVYTDTVVFQDHMYLSKNLAYCIRIKKGNLQNWLLAQVFSHPDSNRTSYPRNLSVVNRFVLNIIRFK